MQAPASLLKNLALGYNDWMLNTNKAAQLLARRSVLVRRQKWGVEGFRKKMRAWGKLGGRPRTKNARKP